LLDKLAATSIYAAEGKQAFEKAFPGKKLEDLVAGLGQQENKEKSNLLAELFRVA
jgi:hypothetical protein